MARCLPFLQEPEPIFEIAGVDRPEKAFDHLGQRDRLARGDGPASHRAGDRFYRAQDVGCAMDRRQSELDRPGRRCGRDRAATPPHHRRGLTRPLCGSVQWLRHRATARQPEWLDYSIREGGRWGFRTRPSETAAPGHAWLFLLFFAAENQSSLHLVRAPGAGHRALPGGGHIMRLWQFYIVAVDASRRH